MITVCLFIIILFHVAPSNNNDIRFLQSQVYVGKCVHLPELPGVGAPENENVVLNAKLLKVCANPKRRARREGEPVWDISKA